MCDCENNNTVPNGIDGYNAFTVTTVAFNQPAVSSNVTVSVSNNGQYSGKWAVAGQTIYIDNGGYYVVVSSTATSITVRYDADYSAFNQALTAVASPVATNSKVSPAGIKGIDGVSGSSILYAYNDLTGTGNDAGTGESTLGSYTVLADELDVNGDQLDIDIYYTYTNNDEVTMRIKFGGSTIFTWTEYGSSDLKVSLAVRISRISSSSQQFVITRQASDSVKQYYHGFVNQAAGTATLSNTNLFSITADNVVVGANQVVLNQLVINKHNA